MKPPLIVVMGVSGAGKTTLGRALAGAVGWDFADADDFHPPENIAKMRAGVPLSDADRAPWLAALGEEAGRRAAAGRPLVLACSALKRTYRDTLRTCVPDARFVFLDGARETLAARLASRDGHFMPASLLDSQLAALEPPSDALRRDLDRPTPAQVAAVRAALGL